MKQMMAILVEEDKTNVVEDLCQHVI